MIDKTVYLLGGTTSMGLKTFANNLDTKAESSTQQVEESELLQPETEGATVEKPPFMIVN